MIDTRIIDKLTRKIVKECDVTPEQAMPVMMLCMVFPEQATLNFKGTGNERLDKAVRIILEDEEFQSMKREV